ncbi:MAG: cysteine desulfurase family protein [Saprospiraceae bacterium]
MERRIYLDNAASTPLHPEVIETMMSTAKNIFGNPSSIHREGAMAKNVLEESRKILAEYLNTSASQVFFTSCATESNNTIIRSACESGRYQHIITSPLEHPAVLKSIQYYSSSNSIQVHYLNPDNHGKINLDELTPLLESNGKNTFVSLIHTHNELGTILPIRIVTELCHKHGAMFHSDTVQSIGLIDLNVTELKIDSIVGSAHKFYGPKGVGFMYLKEPAHIQPFIYGGSQERNMRSGTENLVGIAGMIKALELVKTEMAQRIKHIKILNERLRHGLVELNIPHELNSPTEDCLPKILNVYFDKSANTDWLLMNLDIEGIAVSGGSACSSGSEKASHINEYIRPNSLGRSIRFSFSHLNTEEEIDYTLQVLKRLIL